MNPELLKAYKRQLTDFPHVTFGLDCTAPIEPGFHTLYLTKTKPVIRTDEPSLTDIDLCGHVRDTTVRDLLPGDIFVLTFQADQLDPSEYVCVKVPEESREAGCFYELGSGVEQRFYLDTSVTIDSYQDDEQSEHIKVKDARRLQPYLHADRIYVWVDGPAMHGTRSENLLMFDLQGKRLGRSLSFASPDALVVPINATLHIPNA